MEASSRAITALLDDLAASLDEAWRLEPRDLVKRFLRVPFTRPEGTRDTYDNSTTDLLARMVERVTGAVA